MDIRKEINPELEGELPAANHAVGLPDLACGWVIREYFPAGRLLKLIVPHHPDTLLDAFDSESPDRGDDRMPYWAYLWPAAVQMSNIVIRAEWQPGIRVLELGCGVGLVGLTALAGGCHVSLTDYEQRAVTLAATNARLNGFDAFDAFELDWRSPPELQYPIILGCDLLYEKRNHAPILRLLDKMLISDGICWLGDAGRNAATDFLTLAQARGFTVAIRDADDRPLHALGCDFQLLELFRKPSN